MSSPCRRNNDGPPSESTTVTGALYVENLAAAEKLVRRGQFNAAKVLRALAPAGGISHKDIRRAAVSEWSSVGALDVCSRGSLSYLLLPKYVK